MFTLKAIQAEFGDCLLLKWGSKDDLHHILIDGGPPATYEDHLRDVLSALNAAHHSLDLVILSHIDNDHVVGLVALFSELLQQKASGKPWVIDFGGIWLNSFAQTIDKDGSINKGLSSILSASGTQSLQRTSDAILGVPEGNKLRMLTLQLGKSLNAGFPDELILVDTATEQTF